MLAPTLPLHHVPLLRQKGALKPCLWCKGAFGRIDPVGDNGAPLAVGRMRCETCGRQIGWVGARRLRQALTAKQSFEERREGGDVYFPQPEASASVSPAPAKTAATDRSNGGANIKTKHFNISSPRAGGPAA